MGKLELQGPVKLAAEPDNTPLAPVTVPTANVPTINATPAGDRGEVVVRADQHFCITKYSDGTIRRDNLSKVT